MTLLNPSCDMYLFERSLFTIDYFAASVLSKTGRVGGKKHVQFPDEQSCIEEATEIPAREMEDEKSGKKANKQNINSISFSFIAVAIFLYIFIYSLLNTF